MKNNFLTNVKNFFSIKIGSTDFPKNVVDYEVPMVDVINYTKSFKDFTSTDNVSFKVGHGVIHGFIGPNGSGKTTTIKAMIGAYIPTSGTISINGHKAGTREANSLVGYIPERASFPKHLNTISYLSAMGELSGLSAKESKTRAQKILEDLQLEKQAKRKPITFSSGMQKKILLAQSLLTNPSVLILDEPAANLDPTARKELFDTLIELRNDGKTIIISSHILSELERIIDEVTFIYYGEIIYSGKINDITDKNTDAFIKSSDNQSLKKFLEEQGFEIIGDIKSEVQVVNLTIDQREKLFGYLQKSKINIISFRTNDLQSIYDNLIKNASIKNQGKQRIGNNSTVKHSIKNSSNDISEKKNIKKKGGLNASL